MTMLAATRRSFLSSTLALGAQAAAGPALLSSAGALAADSAADASGLLDAMAWRLLDTDPEQATTLGVDTGTHANLRSRLKDRSPEGIARIAGLLRAELSRIDALLTPGLAPGLAPGAAPLPASVATSLAVVQSAYRTALDGMALPYGDATVGSWRNTPYVVIQNVGAYLDTPRFLDSDHPVRTPGDAEAYLSRLAAMPAQLDGELERLRAAGAMGLVAPAFLIDKAIGQMRQAIADASGGGGAGGGLVQSLVRRTSAMPGPWQARAAGIVKDAVIPALQRQLAALVTQRARATDDAGMWARPHGDAFYAWALRASTTTRRTPDEIHAMGLQQIAELQARMDGILRQLGFTGGTVGERMIALSKDTRFTFADSDAGRAEIVALMQQKIGFIRTRLPLAFRRLVPGRMEIRRLPAAEEAGAPVAYGGPGSIDGTVPGKVFVNLGDVSRHTRYSVPDLVFHEGIPGHVWQGEYANRLPLIRTMLAFNAYTEGWALYAEQLADELGAYDGDPVGQLGFLQFLTYRACRMVVDTGLHAKQWSRAKAVDWFHTTNGTPLTEVSAEVDRYCSWPGQACGYKLGHSEILAQRDKARAALGARYDLRDFNQLVVEGGYVPLDVLARNVDAWIDTARG